MQSEGQRGCLPTGCPDVHHPQHLGPPAACRTEPAREMRNSRQQEYQQSGRPQEHRFCFALQPLSLLAAKTHATSKPFGYAHQSVFGNSSSLTMYAPHLGFKSNCAKWPDWPNASGSQACRVVPGSARVMRGSLIEARFMDCSADIPGQPGGKKLRPDTAFEPHGFGQSPVPLTSRAGAADQKLSEVAEVLELAKHDSVRIITLATVFLGGQHPTKLPVTGNSSLLRTAPQSTPLPRTLRK